MFESSVERTCTASSRVLEVSQLDVPLLCQLAIFFLYVKKFSVLLTGSPRTLDIWRCAQRKFEFRFLQHEHRSRPLDKEHVLTSFMLRNLLNFFSYLSTARLLYIVLPVPCCVSLFSGFSSLFLWFYAKPEYAQTSSRHIFWLPTRLFIRESRRFAI